RDLPALYAVYNVVDRRLEGAIAVAQQHAHCLEPDSAGYDEIDNPVARQVPDRDPIGVRAARVIGYDGLEGAIAVAEHHSCTAVAAAFALPLVAHDNIGNPVAVHVRDCGRVASKTARVIVNHGLKGAVAIAQQHSSRAFGAFVPVWHDIGHDHIQDSNAPQVRERDRVDRAVLYAVG